MASDPAAYRRQGALEVALTQIQQTLDEEHAGIPPQETEGELARLQRSVADMLFVLAARRHRLFPEGAPPEPPEPPVEEEEEPSRAVRP